MTNICSENPYQVKNYTKDRGDNHFKRSWKEVTLPINIIIFNCPTGPFSTLPTAPLGTQTSHILLQGLTKCILLTSLATPYPQPARSSLGFTTSEPAQSDLPCLHHKGALCLNQDPHCLTSKPKDPVRPGLEQRQILYTSPVASVHLTSFHPSHF